MKGDEPRFIGLACWATSKPCASRYFRDAHLVNRTASRDCQQSSSIRLSQSKYFRGVNPLGQHIQVRLGDDVFEQSIREIVGVVGDTKLKNLTADAQPQYYLRFASVGMTNPFLVIRTAGDPALLQDSVRAAVRETDASVPVFQVATLEDYVSKSAAQPRFQTFVLTCFAAIALILAAVGLYGLLSYMVVQRTLEIGLRMAMGAER